MGTGAFWRTQAGFSYLGLLTMISIVGAMAAAAATAGSAMQRRAAEEELLFIGSQFQAAFKTYYESTPPGSRPYPLQLKDLLRDPRSPAPRRHLRQLFADPLTGKSDWGTVEAPGGGIMGVYSLATETPIRLANFDSAFALFEGKTKYPEWIFTYQPPAIQALGH